MHGTKLKRRRKPSRHEQADTPVLQVSADEVALSYVRREVDTLVRLDPLVRQGDARAVHRTRVAARRIRSALKTFESLFDPAETLPLREELQWLGGVLAPAREADVLGERLLSGVGRLPAELVIGPVAARIRGEAAQRSADAVRDTGEGLLDERHARLSASLRVFVNSPVVTATASRPAAKVCRVRVLAASRRVDRLAQLAASQDGAEQTETMHDVRKAAKRARYAADATAKVLGDPARTLAGRMSALQDVLGDHLDSGPAQQELRALGMRAHLAGENAFTYGLLLGVERAAAAETLRAYPTRLAEAQQAAAALST